MEATSWWALALLLLILAFLVILFLAWTFRYRAKGSIYQPIKPKPSCPWEACHPPEEEPEPQVASHSQGQEIQEDAPAEESQPSAEPTEVSVDKGLQPNPTGLLDFCRGLGQTDLLTDSMNCGECGKTCRFIHAQGQCIDGECVLGSCEQGWGNCDGLVSNGCEADLTTDRYNCGSCGISCPTIQHGTSKCQQGQCAVDTCDAGWANCDGTLASGCAVFLLTDPMNCGECGTVCPTGALCSGGQCYCPSCSEVVDGVCTQKKCAPGFQCIEDACRQVNECGHGGFCPPPRICQNSPGGYMCICPSDMTDCGGTCVDLKTSPFHCGSCQHGCELPNANTSCQSGECKIMGCESGFAQCQGNPDGPCDTNLLTNSSHCGACNHACGGAFPNGRSTCEGGECVLTCTLGFANCNDPSLGNAWDKGCDIDLMTDSNHCGSCNHACDPATGFVCIHGECQCSKGLTRCGQVCVDTFTSQWNCGECGLACTEDMLCVDGRCEQPRLSCGMGTVECGGTCVSILVDPQNCGQCGRACGPGSRCVEGTCSAAA